MVSIAYGTLSSLKPYHCILKDPVRLNKNGLFFISTSKTSRLLSTINNLNDFEKLFMFFYYELYPGYYPLKKPSRYREWLHTGIDIFDSLTNRGDTLGILIGDLAAKLIFKGHN